MCALAVPASGSSQRFSFKGIYSSYLKCRRNKRNSNNALRFEINASENIAKLESQLLTKSYRPSPAILFTAQKPKLREIFASPFHDRVVHHVLIEELSKIWEPKFIFDSYACRDGKGTHIAVKRLQGFLRRETMNGNVRAYYLQLDIKDFFISINKQILFNLVKKHLKDPELLWLAEKTIFWNCTKNFIAVKPMKIPSVPFNKSLFGKNNERGLPIGNLTSQFLANLYLNELDQYVKHELKIKYYLRYVDDFVILGSNPDELRALKDKIQVFLSAKLNLTLHPRRHKLMPVSTGIDFLGYIVRQNYILVRRRVLNNLKVKIRSFKSSPVRDFVKLRDTFASYLGHFKWANSYKLINSLQQTIITIKESPS